MIVVYGKFKMLLNVINKLLEFIFVLTNRDSILFATSSAKLFLAPSNTNMI